MTKNTTAGKEDWAYPSRIQLQFKVSYTKSLEIIAFITRKQQDLVKEMIAEIRRYPTRSDALPFDEFLKELEDIYGK